MKNQYDEMSILSPLPDSVMWLIRVVFNPSMNLWGDFGDKCMMLIFNEMGRPRRTWGLKWMELNEMTTRVNYRKHNINFLNTCPEEKRLVLEKLGEWKDICDFVGVKVPEFEFPHANKGGSITAQVLEGKAGRKDDEINVEKVVKQEIRQRLLMVMLILSACIGLTYCRSL